MSWPREVFQAPLLRGLDERGKAELEAAGRLRELAVGATAYRSGEKGDALFVLARGAVSLHGRRRGDDDEQELRTVAAGDSFGEEACIGATWRATARATEAALAAEIPVAMLKRALARAGGGEVAERFERRLRRSATAELFRTAAFTRELSERDLDMVLDAAEQRELARGEIVYRAGEPPTALWLVADGMVQLQTEDEERLRVRAYLVRGDFFGDEELLSGLPRQVTAVTSGACLLVSIPAAVARTVADRNPELLRKLRRVAAEQQGEQRALVGRAASHATQHAFRDLYRLQIARSLLVIDLETCVRCGHCAWACESLHGVARLVRRGDKIVTRVDEHASVPLLLPNSCQHCENPACMPDCPTGAIGRDVQGEVYIREALCTGCGACAKGCPWDNIQIVPRPAGARQGGMQRAAFPELAVKCDLCHDWDAPACVRACPTESIWRIQPSEELPEVAALLGPREARARSRARSKNDWPLAVAAFAVGAAIGIYGVSRQVVGAWAPWRGAGLGLGIGAAVAMVLLAAYTVPKRAVRLWQKRRQRSLRERDERPATVRSLVRPQLALHVALGLVTLGPAVAHGGTRFGASAGGALLAAFGACSALGVLALASYALVPRLLARLERSAALPEDFATARRELTDRLYAGVSGKSELVKTLFERVLVPYVRRPFGWIALIVSRRDLAREQRALRERIDRMLEGRGAERLAGLDGLVRLVVELRALRGQRLLTVVLRLWLPLHAAAGAVALALLVVHVVQALGRGGP